MPAGLGPGLRTASGASTSPPCDCHTEQLEQLALKHKARAEAAEATRRMAFDPCQREHAGVGQPFQADVRLESLNYNSPDVGPAATEMRIEPTAARATDDPRCDHEHRNMKNEPRAQNKAKVICAGRAGSAERLRVTARAGPRGHGSSE